MQPICLTVLIWLVRQTSVVGRSRSLPVHEDIDSVARPSVASQKLRGPALRSRHDDSLVHGSEADSRTEDVQVFLRKPQGKKDKKKKKGAKKGKGKRKDKDDLADELIDQATTRPFKKRFERVDQNGDGKIDEHEYFASTRAPKRIASNRFNCSDENQDYSISLKEFSDAQSHPRDLERCVGMMLAFKLVDKDRDGGISQDELWSNVGGPGFDARWGFMIACSDRNGDGRVSPMEFSKDMYGCMEEKSDAAMVAFANFSKSDRDGSGCVNETEMADALNMLFGINLICDRPPSQATRKLTRRWMSCVDFNSDQCLTKKEYNELLDPTPAQSQCTGKYYEKYEADMDFQIMDTNNDNRVSKQEYYTWVDRLELQVDQQDADRLFEKSDKDKNGFIEESEFHHAGEAYEGDGPAVLFFRHSSPPSNSSRAWRGSIQKTWAGFYKS